MIAQAAERDSAAPAARLRVVVSRPRARARTLVGAQLRAAALLGFTLSVGLLARSFTAAPDSAQAYALFWAGLGLCLAAAIATVLSPHHRAWHLVLALSLVGGVLFIPTYLRNPAYPIFQDGLFHVQTLAQMRDLHSTQVPITFFPIAGDYPGIEFLGLATHFASGLPLAVVVQIVPLGIHLVIPPLAYLALRSCRLSSRAAFFGALVYISNSGFYFFHSAFSYESLGIVLFLFVAVLSIRLVQQKRWRMVSTSLVLMAAVAATVVTHHMSSLLVMALLLVLGLASLLLYGRRRAALGNLTIFAGALWVGWLIYQTSNTIHYLSQNLVARVHAILAFILSEQRGSRQLFSHSALPRAEQIVAYLYPLTAAALVGVGGLYLLRRWRRRRSLRSLPPVYAGLLVLGPLLWAATAPFVLTHSSDVVYRSWPFLFLGLALFAAWAFERPRAKPRWSVRLRLLLAYPAIGIVFAGGIIVGDNQAGRFRPAELHAAAGPEALTDDLVSSATWLERTAGRYNLIVGDESSRVAFAAFGFQRADLWATWLPFYTPDPNRAQSFLNAYGVRYVVVDERDSRYPSRYNHYFSQAEVFDARLDGTDFDGATFPADRLQKFDTMPRLDRVYDNGDIILYRNDANGSH